MSSFQATSYVKLLPVPPPGCLSKILHILRSLVPWLTFLFLYAINNVVHIQPILEDLGCVHVYTISTFEEHILGFHLHKIVSSWHAPFLDFMAALPYLLHYPIPVIFPLYLWFRDRTEDIPKFYWLLGWVMWAHYFIWLVFPHSPPWVLDHLAHSNSTTVSLAMQHKEGCAFRRIDAITGLPFFYNMFAGNPIPYGSFPSGHVAWPTAIHTIGGPGGNLFILYIVWMTWATLYSCHHYITDAVGALLVVFITNRVVTYLQSKGLCNTDYKCKPSGIACPLHV